MKTLNLSATLAVLIFTASTACAAVTDVGAALGPSGAYTSRQYYQSTLGGQPMTADQQAYADHEDQLRQMGFQSELRGDFGLGQMFYGMAYGVSPNAPALDWLGGGSGFGQRSAAPGHSVFWDGGASDGGSASAIGDSFETYSTVSLALIGSAPGWTSFAWGILAVPEPSTWAMMLIGFAGLVAAGRRGAARLAPPVRIEKGSSAASC